MSSIERSDALPLDREIPAALARPEAYPGDPSAAAGVHEVQTHLSWVFLTGERVYKLKKSLDVGFVSFVSQAARNRNALAELALNRRLAPDVYLGVAKVEREDGSFAVGPVDPDPRSLPPGEHCLVMRRLPGGRDAASLLEAGALPPAWIDGVADRIAAFHERERLGRPSPFSPEEWRQRILDPVEANFESLFAKRPEALAEREVEALRDASRARFDALTSVFERRRLEGRAVDGHGDLHLDHVWFEAEDGVPLVIDCLEFDERLRRIDAASEVAFLAMDLGFRGRPDLAERWLARYALAADDYGLYEVVDFFESYRAAVRGKVEAIAAADPRIAPADREASGERAVARVRFARERLAARPPGRIHAVGGMIGSGKSSVARILAETTAAVVISSDELRRRDPQVTALGSDGSWEGGRYSPEARGRIYDDMLERAAPVLSSGRPVVLDASFSSAARREALRHFAEQHGTAVRFLETRCGREETLARLSKRRRAGRDASEAGPEIYDRFAASFEPVAEGEWPAGAHEVVRTDVEGWRDIFRQGLATRD